MLTSSAASCQLKSERLIGFLSCVDLPSERRTAKRVKSSRKDNISSRLDRPRRRRLLCFWHASCCSTCCCVFIRLAHHNAVCLFKDVLPSTVALILSFACYGKLVSFDTQMRCFQKSFYTSLTVHGGERQPWSALQQACQVHSCQPRCHVLSVASQSEVEMSFSRLFQFTN